MHTTALIQKQQLLSKTARRALGVSKKSMSKLVMVDIMFKNKT